MSKPEAVAWHELPPKLARPCARCGRRPRARDTFLCDTCLDDPEQQREAVEALTQTEMPARTYVLKRFRWAGLWGDRGRG